MNEIQTGRFGRILQGILAIRDKNPSGVIAPEIVPALVLENDRPEWAYLGNERLCASAFPFAAGGVGFYGEVYLTNPTGSNCLAVLEEIEFLQTGTSAVQFELGQMSTPNASPSVGTFVCVTTDTRDASNIAGSALQTSCRVEGHYTATPSANRAIRYAMSRTNTDAKMARFQRIDQILTPGTQMILTCITANTEFLCSWKWRERAIEETEV